MAAVIALLLIVLAPFSVGGAAYLAQLARHDHGGLLTFPVAFAVVGIIAAVVGTFLAVLGVLYLLQVTELLRALTPGLLVAIVVLDVIPPALAAFLRLAARREIP